ncbi:hypothetical protein KIN20_029427 [Parelaphostrongylus tenuis]|uniref:Uncharacterized protein n=1 Tax=Parelaphostrongylus tenuis TaxID=148309 RepID=A0AAD5R2E7_PARTN|nr:hypothetical protein KIN20_029427 [Parelaphostrongylus tenuis]
MHRGNSDRPEHGNSLQSHSKYNSAEDHATRGNTPEADQNTGTSLQRHSKYNSAEDRATRGNTPEADQNTGTSLQRHSKYNSAEDQCHRGNISEADQARAPHFRVGLDNVSLTSKAQQAQFSGGPCHVGNTQKQTRTRRASLQRHSKYNSAEDHATDVTHQKQHQLHGTSLQRHSKYNKRRTVPQR